MLSQLCNMTPHSQLLIVHLFVCCHCWHVSPYLLYSLCSFFSLFLFRSSGVASGCPDRRPAAPLQDLRIWRLRLFEAGVDRWPQRPSFQHQPSCPGSSCVFGGFPSEWTLSPCTWTRGPLVTPQDEWKHNGCRGKGATMRELGTNCSLLPPCKTVQPAQETLRYQLA